MEGEIEGMEPGGGWSMVIGIDFDHTYTNDPAMWDDVISLIKAHGHRVICVTARHLTEENRAEVKIPGIYTYFTGMVAKERYLMDNYRIRVDVWIDDSPRYIVENR